MITFEEAVKIAENRIPQKCALFRDEIIEKAYGWYFCYQSKDYIETGSISDMLIGSGGFLVEKENGNVVEFGSAHLLEKNFETYEKGLLGRNDLIILKVRDIDESVRLLNRLQMKNFESKSESNFESGVKLLIPKTYKQNEIKSAISKLPCIFKNQDFYFRFDEFQEIDRSKCFDYELRKTFK